MDGDIRAALNKMPRNGFANALGPCGDKYIFPSEFLIGLHASPKFYFLFIHLCLRGAHHNSKYIETDKGHLSAKTFKQRNDTIIRNNDGEQQREAEQDI